MSSNAKNDELPEIDIELPGWLKESIPAPRPVKKLIWDDANETFIVVSQENKVLDFYDTIVEAYDSHSELNSEETLVFDESVNGHGGELVSDFFLCDSDDKYGKRLLGATSDNTSEWLLNYSYVKWLDFYESWSKDKENWVKAYHFISHHPAFWIADEELPTYHWTTDRGARDLWHAVLKGDDGKDYVCLETGGHVPPSYDHCYHDLRLDVSALTFEEAYIKLAFLVDKFFYPDGTKREGVEYEPSELEITLKERMEELNKKLSE